MWLQSPGNFVENCVRTLTYFWLELNPLGPLGQVRPRGPIAVGMPLLKHPRTDPGGRVSSTGVPTLGYLKASVTRPRIGKDTGTEGKKNFRSKLSDRAL